MSLVGSAVLVSGTLVCAAVGSSRAAPAGGGWLAPIPDFATDAGDLQVAITPDGERAFAAWGSYDGTYATETRADGSWEVLPTELVRGTAALDPQLAVDRAGNALLTFTKWAGSSQILAFTLASGTTDWVGPTAVSAPERDTGHEDLAANGDGQAVIAWAAPEGALSVTRAALRSGSGAWAPPENLGYAGSSPHAAIDGAGNAVVIWTRGPDSLVELNATDVWVDYRSVTGGWEPARTLTSHATSGTQVQVAMNRRGDALAVWAEAGRLVSSRRLAGTSSWDAPATIPLTQPWNAYYSYEGISVALDERGEAILVDSRDDGQIEAVTLPPGAQTWEPPVVIGGSTGTAWYARDGTCLRPLIGLDAAGNAIVIWGGSSLYAARRAANSRAWSGPLIVEQTPVCYQRALAVAASGDAIAYFIANADGARTAHAAILDATPPTLVKLEAPRTAIAGRRARFSIATHDTWSRLRGYQWSFGDGALLRTRGSTYTLGNSASVVSHTYKRPGSYRVTVSATDKAGNTLRRALTVVVRSKR